MAEYKKSEITYLAKQICKINEKLFEAISAAEELTHNEDIKTILSDPGSSEFHELCTKVEKYANIYSPADTCLYGSELDDATEILKTVFAEVDW